MSDLPTLRGLRLVHGAGPRKGIRHWWLVLSVFFVDLKIASLALLERPLFWAVHQLPAKSQSKVAARYRMVEYR